MSKWINLEQHTFFLDFSLCHVVNEAKPLSFLLSCITKCSQGMRLLYFSRGSLSFKELFRVTNVKLKHAES